MMQVEGKKRLLPTGGGRLPTTALPLFLLLEKKTHYAWLCRVLLERSAMIWIREEMGKRLSGMQRIMRFPTEVFLSISWLGCIGQGVWSCVYTFGKG